MTIGDVTASKTLDKIELVFHEFKKKQSFLTEQYTKKLGLDAVQ